MSPESLLERAREVVEAPLAPPAHPEWLGPGWEGIRGIGRFVDHTLLAPTAARADVLRLCDEAVRFGAAAVCVNGRWAALCARRLEGSGVRPAVVVGFPLGAMHPEVTAGEAARAVADGAAELDLVLPLGLLKAGEWEQAGDELRRVIAAAGGVPVKAILETAALTPLEAAAAALLARDAGARWVKTSTGFHPAGGATTAMVALLRRAVGCEAGVKASGGIRTAEDALRLLAAGADRLGTSRAVAMAEVMGEAAPPLGELLAPYLGAA
ncbi:MAG TPA: deoxyribose-phosphate aldolase [Gemmatimonadales bacterium]|nr:deoxyribose-phosphate aldolase [Gemmatimonadales bacterium]